MLEIDGFQLHTQEYPVKLETRWKKDGEKAKYCNKIIAYGTGSTGKYAAAFGGTAEEFEEGDVVMISVNGRGRPNQAENVEKTKQMIAKAVGQGVRVFIADNEYHANRAHNIDGEGKIAKFMELLGYDYAHYNDFGVWFVV